MTTSTTFDNYAHAVLGVGAQSHPDRLAVSHGDDRRLTFRELDDRVNRRANALLSAGIQPGQRVAVLLSDPLEITEIYLALAKIGAVFAAMNPYWTDEVAIQLIERSRCTAFAYDPNQDRLAEAIRAQLPTVTRMLRVQGASAGGDTVDLDQLTIDSSDAAPDLNAHHDDELALFFTSGSTGLPKAVVHTHRSGIAIAQQWLDVPRSPRSVFGTGPIIWGIGFVAIAGPALYAGMPLVLEPDFGPSRFVDLAARRGITHISVIPSFFTEFFGDEGHREADLSSLEVILLGGEPLHETLRRKIIERFPGVAVCSYYGQTEAPYSVIGRQDDGRQPTEASGRARTGGAVQVVDEDGVAVVDTVGTIRIAGPHVMSGYDGDPARTATDLRDGWFYGGDIGTLSVDGVLTVLGRRSDAVARPGGLLMPRDIEEVALTLPGVLEAGAVAVPEHGDHQKVLLVVAVAEPASVDAGELRAEITAKLPTGWGPDAVVVTDELPHANDSSGGRGKLLRREIRERWQHTLA